VPRLAGSSKLLRAMNESAALAHLLERGQLTRNDLRELTGLSKPTISEALRRLTDAGLASVVGHVSAGPGPNAEVYAANPDAAYAVAMSVRDSAVVAVTSLEAAVCDLTGTVRGRVESDVDFVSTDPVAAVCNTFKDVCERSGVPAGRVGHVQIGVAGSYNAGSDTIHYVDVPGWSRPGLIGELRERLSTEVGVDNDVNLAAIAERSHGVATDVDGFALLWLGESGLGLAIDLGGTLLRGARGGAGEIGYMPLFTPEGQNRKIDFHDLVGGENVLALAHDHGFGGRTPGEAVAAAVAAGSEATGEFLSALADRIAFGLAAVVAVLDPPLVVLAGQVGRAGGPALRDAVSRAMAHAAPLETTIASTAIDDDPVLLGALGTGLTAVREALIASVHSP
jgi:predicted NBD/HSP70 family sugar kinase/DNA-binding transcriptional ArsR family regulator